ncbi:MAG TPA: hypothetical protein DEQ87_12205 [Algoriphagus sp.]|uniref:O-antigen polymerase n=1 Tax=Algoriphagus TaxID=246875 RepID=UPI000C618D9E|nr:MULTISPECIES: O-antigen polymerase [Algoriphagus]MAL13421.1 hypothetical protein [Algoriphagus sp.]HAS58980.1 hypothetical protein [Algoriphagus sp.]HCD88381.1 hypothetical protein [Algoriphagus sp.]|tara:strand:- start:11684 stop:12952 length:1269 start_codon:yes stop_codon:yes gene_type:complete
MDSNFYEDHNVNFLNRLHPSKVMAFAFIIWAILFLFSPLVVNIELNGTAYVFLFCCILSFILGVALVKDKIGFRTSKSANNLRRLFFLILYLAILGLALKLTDRFIIRGISSSSNYFENREIMEAAGGNYIAILSSFLTPLGIIPIFLLWKHKISTNWIVKIIAFILFFAQIFDAVLLGSRSIIFVLFILLGLYLFYFQKIKITLLKGLGIVMVILSFMLMMNFIFVERTKIFAGENTYDLVLNQSNINYTVTSSNSFKNTFSNLNPTTQSLVFTYLTTTQYFTHGMIEFSYLYDNYKNDYALGSYTFAIYSRFLHKVTGRNFDSKNLEQLSPRPGVFNTFFGPIFIDFGWFSLLFMLLFGMIVKVIYNKAKSGYDWAIILYFYFFIVIAFSPVFNFINGAGGIFILTSIVLFYIISKIKIV